jgi:hypothetical protein
MVAVLDIECANWDTFVTGALSIDGDVFVTRNQDDLIDALLSYEGDVWAHNGGRYDWLWVLDKLTRRLGSKAKIWLSGSSATRIDVGKTILRDSFRLVPMGLGKAAGIAGLKKAEVGFDCDCGHDCGGYCRIDPDMPERDYARLEEYLRVDCQVLDAVLTVVQDFALDNQIELRGTVGGSAWATAKTWLDLPNAKWHTPIYNFARLGYYGGRSEVARTYTPWIERYDIHSAYPAALTHARLPHGEPKQFVRHGAKQQFDSRAPGIYKLTIDVPDMLAPPLPIRTGERIVYPTGRITGEWTQPAIEHAIEVGCNPVEFVWALVWPFESPILAPVAQRLWDLRDAAARAGQSALAQWIKWLVNSLTGKLAQDPESRSIALCHSPPKSCPGGACDGRCTPGRCCNHQCTKRCGAWEPIGPRCNLWSRPAWRMPACAYVQWAAYLTSINQVELHSQIMHAGDDWVYTDTDSVYSRVKLMRRLGEALGEWGHEGSGEDWRAIAPKAYYYRQHNGPESPTWVETVRCKGLSRLTPGAWEQYARGEPVTIDSGVEGLLTAARRGHSLFTRRTLTRKSNHALRSEWCGGRVINHGDGSTRAPTMQEIEKGRLS